MVEVTEPVELATTNSSRWTFTRPGPLRRLLEAEVPRWSHSMDLFAGPCRAAQIRNDPNPEHAQPYQLDAAEFVAQVRPTLSYGPCLLIVDPPYSDRQARRYGPLVESMASLYARVRRQIRTHARRGDAVLWAGWSSWGMLPAPGWVRQWHRSYRTQRVTPDVHVTLDVLEPQA